MNHSLDINLCGSLEGLSHKRWAARRLTQTHWRNTTTSKEMFKTLNKILWMLYTVFKNLRTHISRFLHVPRKEYIREVINKIRECDPPRTGRVDSRAASLAISAIPHPLPSAASVLVTPLAALSSTSLSGSHSESYSPRESSHCQSHCYYLPHCYLGKKMPLRVSSKRRNTGVLRAHRKLSLLT